MKNAQAAAAVALAVLYFSYVFQVWQPAFRQAGIGDWGDPYFINFLLEHWYYSLTTLSNPASPPMFSPETGTLGYSHGLILYAPVYAAVRSVLGPLQAHTATILLVLLIGSLSLYVILRQFAGLTFVESVLLTAFFSTSRNVINPGTSIWSQTASVFLIPPILLMALFAARSSPGALQTALAGLSGLLAALLFTQEFYTAQFALFFVAAAVLAVLVQQQPSAPTQIRSFWREEPRTGVRIAAVAMVLTGAWAVYLLLFGGGTIEIAGVRIASRDWRRPAAVFVAAFSVLVYRRGRPALRLDVAGAKAWILPFVAGACVGCGVFFWIYLGAYLQYGRFSETDLMGLLRSYEGGGWYESFRPFTLAFLTCLVSCVPIPWLRVDASVRRYCGAAALLSLVALLAPVRFDSFSAWNTFLAPLPGFGAIRDPRRIIQVYELLVVLLTALFLIRHSSRSPVRIGISVLLLVLMVTDWNREVFVIARPAGDFQRWVEAPIDVSPECKHFVIKRASPVYSARWDNKFILYGVDASFVALRQSRPTLNGYSAWVPADWHLMNPEDATYREGVAQWVDRHQMKGVCEFDIEARTMTPYASGAR